MGHTVKIEESFCPPGRWTGKMEIGKTFDGFLEYYFAIGLNVVICPYLR